MSSDPELRQGAVGLTKTELNCKFNLRVTASATRVLHKQFFASLRWPKAKVKCDLIEVKKCN